MTLDRNDLSVGAFCSA